ncbi:hypothetical protein O181_072901 [Austropuccinia psidii MF-1]|uniref:SGF29 C-terminal domain-containing protein n=1 Tax=Austropuccinia psidii MF-1 TaxID=1389203 RepID=A0A9Q3I7T2_9BASI|nr:hypothetical protein [Austropuccinia psidii MF-1]
MILAARFRRKKLAIAPFPSHSNCFSAVEAILYIPRSGPSAQRYCLPRLLADSLPSSVDGHRLGSHELGLHHHAHPLSSPILISDAIFIRILSVIGTMRRRLPINYSSAHSGEALSIWRDLHQRLNQLALVQARALQSSIQLSNATPTQIDSLIEQLWNQTNQENGILDICLERLGILIALREAPDPPLPGRLAKKRRLEPSNNLLPANDRGGSSPLAGTSLSTLTPSATTTLLEANSTHSPASRASPSPLPLSSLPLSFTLTQTRSQAASRSSTPLSDVAVTKRLDSVSSSSRPQVRSDKRINFRDQLPLLPGRLVAFKRPKKSSESGGVEDWIMAKVVKSIGGDKNRYEVEDIDEDGRVGGKQSSWNTTIKSIIPLPVKNHPESYPSTTLQPGSIVLGLYPETTSFYRGEVKSGPTEKGKKYKILFDDDEDTGTVDVIMEHIIPIN